jgi:hypothetical protein
MVRDKNYISGKKISGGKYEVVDGVASKLIPGQRVLVYKSTGRNVVAASGKILGQKEQVIGAGEVSSDGDKLVVKLPYSKIDYHYRAKILLPKIAKQSLNGVKPLKKRRLRSSDGNVLIKAIEE